jgi:hydrogenase/urease accessory protein HupE
MQTATVKGSLQLFGVIAVGTALFGLWQGYGIGETLTAAVILSAFVVGIAWAGARAERRFNRK